MTSFRRVARLPARLISLRLAARSSARGAAVALAAALVSCGGGGDGGTPPIVVASVVITAPVGAPAFQTFGRTQQFTAEARDAANAVIAGRPIGWTSSVTGVATISAAGLMTVVGNGTTQIRATATGTAVQSTPITVTVDQVAAATVATPGTLAFGAIGSTRQLAAAAQDSSGATIAALTAVTWSSLGDGATADVALTGLVTALAIGNSDSAVATLGARADTVPISVTQVVATVDVTSTGSDTLATTTRTKSYAAAARDSQANLMAGAAIAWSSTTPATASVDAGTGLATALTDGTTNIRATSGTIFGQKALTVRRYALVFDLTPLDATFTTPAQNQLFTSDARDSVDTVLPTSWLSRNTGIATASAAAGATTTVTAAGNGMTFIIRSAGTRVDSAQINSSGQPVGLPTTAEVLIGSFFFRSVRNLSENPATDTIAAGGTVNWTWGGGGLHSVTSTTPPTFTSSTTKNSGTHQVLFTDVGDYSYQCSVHPEMQGAIIVRTP